ncbi:hypothetical protein [Methylomagnum sp.]
MSIEFLAAIVGAVPAVLSLPGTVELAFLASGASSPNCWWGESHARHAGFLRRPIANTRMDEALDWIVGRVREKAPSLVAFVNPDCLNIAYRHAEYHKILAHAARVLPDGIGIFYSGRIPRAGCGKSARNGCFG